VFVAGFLPLNCTGAHQCNSHVYFVSLVFALLCFALLCFALLQLVRHFSVNYRVLPCKISSGSYTRGAKHNQSQLLQFVSDSSA